MQLAERAQEAHAEDAVDAATRSKRLLETPESVEFTVRRYQAIGVHGRPGAGLWRHRSSASKVIDRAAPTLQ